MCRRFDLLATATTPPRRINFRREKGREDRNNKGDKRKQKENEIINNKEKDKILHTAALYCCWYLVIFFCPAMGTCGSSLLFSHAHIITISTYLRGNIHTPDNTRSFLFASLFLPHRWLAFSSGEINSHRTRWRRDAFVILKDHRRIMRAGPFCSSFTFSYFNDKTNAWEDRWIIIDIFGLPWDLLRGTPHAHLVLFRCWRNMACQHASALDPDGRDWNQIGSSNCSATVKVITMERGARAVTFNKHLAPHHHIQWLNKSDYRVGT